MQRVLRNHMRLAPRLVCPFAAWLADRCNCASMALRRPIRENSLLGQSFWPTQTRSFPASRSPSGCCCEWPRVGTPTGNFPATQVLPTEMKWKLPPGWKIGEIQWPIPLKTIDPGDIETYGYENEVLLMQEITPPAKIDSSSAKLSAEANWLVCEKICIPGGATLQLDLPVASTSQPANTDVFARYRRLLPQNLPGT